MKSHFFSIKKLIFFWFYFSKSFKSSENERKFPPDETEGIRWLDFLFNVPGGSLNIFDINKYII